MLAAGVASFSRVGGISQAFLHTNSTVQKLIVQRARTMRASEAPRVLKRMTADIGKSAEVKDGELFSCDQSRKRIYRKRRKSRPIANDRTWVVALGGFP